VLLIMFAAGLTCALTKIPFGQDKMGVARHYIEEGVTETGASNIVTSVVVNYRGFDTLGEVTVLFAAALGVTTLLFVERPQKRSERESASLIVVTGSKLLFPPIILFGIYVFLHGHLTPGGGFQGGAVIASGFLLLYLARPERTMRRGSLSAAESLGGLVFVVVGLLGIVFAGHFLENFLPKGRFNLLMSAGIIPLIYVAIGVKVGSELGRIIGDMVERD
jgi:multicomponent Na+:H+ antiporter subunit B